jgi:2-polyprenyl-6-methoxyphenol hydroxylase-like FAD-dependent oxidoreductase
MTSAIIVGAGIAGPATAMALQQVGISAEIFEGRARSDGEVGSYVTVAPNGLDALDAIGGLALARRIGFPSRRSVLMSARGRTLATLSLGRPLPDGTVGLTMKRTRLALALCAEAERRGIEVHHGRRLADASARPDGSVQAVFEDGTSATADLLVGADGVHSVTRHIIDRQAPRGRYVGLTNFGGVTTTGLVEVEAAPEEWRFLFGRHAFFGYHLTGQRDVIWFVNAPRPQITAMERRGTSTDQWQEWLAGLFAHDRGPAAELITVGALELVADNTYDLPRVPAWRRGSMVVVGDAAHAPSPSSGQGASMSLEDAVVLAGSLRRAPSVAAGLATYEARRRTRVERIVRYGARSSSTKTSGPMAAVVRDAILPLVLRAFGTDRSTRWMTGHRVDRGEVAAPTHR